VGILPTHPIHFLMVTVHFSLYCRGCSHFFFATGVAEAFRILGAGPAPRGRHSSPFAKVSVCSLCKKSLQKSVEKKKLKFFSKKNSLGFSSFIYVCVGYQGYFAVLGSVCVGFQGVARGIGVCLRRTEAYSYAKTQTRGLSLEQVRNLGGSAKFEQVRELGGRLVTRHVARRDFAKRKILLFHVNHLVPLPDGQTVARQGPAR